MADQGLESLTKDVQFTVSRNANGSYAWDAIRTSALIRIASACERMTEDVVRLKQDNDYLRNRLADEERANLHLRHRLAGLQGWATRLSHRGQA